MDDNTKIELKSISSTMASINALNLYVEKLEDDYNKIESNYLKYKIILDQLTQNNYQQINNFKNNSSSDINICNNNNSN
ncbi:hypothetical protein DICPUDRAFT_160323 [Dictyostelium purpureum]|uniref:Uncharacterized protein n=1 Tax=Dictyostelium purpureum TaxID=5786 RepID=F1A651_DICPU|nr:uncharacterized protein DICPUDRAFT_160323 [Dictyostelium purpureum]EGC28327.1 hypothetical protein DICPUDRAFT_160323 [Dictyostelium purpureum]|eukprot:XP_003295145.1 hypothetical protein DICPUDRAFT_160323 [Dictyostelium purpureum]